MPVDRGAAARAIDAFLLAIGRDSSAEPELRGTGARVTAAFVDELCTGYAKDPTLLVRHGVVVGSTTVVALRDVAVTTTCPHHLMPARGHATIAFAPQGKLVGLGVLAELVDAYAHRLTLQEEIGESVAKTLIAETGARWAICHLVLSHGCVTARGERKHDAVAETIAFQGDAALFQEALAVLKGAA